MKYLKLFSLIALSSIAIGSNAQNVLSSESINASNGDNVEVRILLHNVDEMNSMNFDVMLPTGWELTGNEYDLTDRTYLSRRDGWSFTVEPSDGYLRIIGSTQGTPLEVGTLDENDTDGVLILFLKAGSDFNGELSFNNVAASGADTPKSTMKYKICNLGANGYSTYSNNEIISFDTEIIGANSYFGQRGDDVITLIEVENNIVPAGQGVVLKGNEGEPVYAQTADATVSGYKNDLKGTGNGSAISEALVLSTKDGVTGFYKYSGSYIGAGKSYIEGSAPLRIITDTTGIENVESEQNVEAIFNLQGQKQQEVKAGINIVNGKKVLY